jgi:hypothetical protein
MSDKGEGVRCSLPGRSGRAEGGIWVVASEEQGAYRRQSIGTQERGMCTLCHWWQPVHKGDNGVARAVMMDGGQGRRDM